MYVYVIYTYTHKYTHSVDMIHAENLHQWAEFCLNPKKLMVEGVATIEWCSIFLSILAYSMWKYRNGRLFEDNFNIFRAVIAFEENVEEFGFLERFTASASTSLETDKLVPWEPPQFGWTKVNIDASFNEDI